jgi:hypothetical protein
MGLSGSWFESCVVSSCKNAPGPSWLVMFAEVVDVDDVDAVLDVVPLLINEVIGNVELVEVPAMVWSP